jgi:TRAP-type C4-dicarboxylate transport system permease small subunit
MLKRVDHLLWRAERWLAAALFLVMVLVMFTGVSYRVAAREVAAASVDGRGTLYTIGGVVLAVCILAARTRRRNDGLTRSWLASLLIGTLAAVVAFGYVVAVLEVFPTGLEWAPNVALACMLWVGFLGASIATHERRHLALEMGEKIWPRRALRWVQALAFVAAAAMCVFLLALAWLSLKDHHASWSYNPLTSIVEATPIPLWLVFAIFPYTFVVMGLRFLAQALGSAAGRAPQAPERAA